MSRQNVRRFSLSLSLLWRASFTRQIRRSRRINRAQAADAQLPVAVVAPALDPTPADNRARVVVSQGDGDGGDACDERQRLEVEKAMNKV